MLAQADGVFSCIALDPHVELLALKTFTICSWKTWPDAMHNYNCCSHGSGYGSVCALLSNGISLKKAAAAQDRFHSSLFRQVLSHPLFLPLPTILLSWMVFLLLGPVNRALHVPSVE